MIFFAQRIVQQRRYEVFKTTLMIVSLIMSGVSVCLFIYWLRYTCQLILSAKSARDYSRDVAEANNLLFLQVQQELAQVRERFDLDALHSKLENDYRLLTYLLVHGPAFHASGDRLEQIMLMLNFRLLKAYYALSCPTVGVDRQACAARNDSGGRIFREPHGRALRIRGGLPLGNTLPKFQLQYSGDFS